MKPLTVNAKNCVILLIANMGLIGCAGIGAGQEQVGQQQLNVIRGVCNGRGLQEGTPQYTNCVFEVGTRLFGGPVPAQSTAPGSCFGSCGPGGGAGSSMPGNLQGTQTYIINGRTVMCTTTGTITTCY